jgi:cytochrome P450
MTHSSRATIDFDHHHPTHVLTALDTYARFREESPVAWSPHYGGFWMISRYEDVTLLTREPDAFLSAKTFDEEGSPQGGVTIPPMHIWVVPTETDKPDWARYRTALAPLFTPGPIAKIQSLCRNFAHELVDRVIESGEIDLVLDLANPIPSLMTMHVLGIPIEEWQRFAIPLHQGAYAQPGSPEALEAQRGVESFIVYIRDQIAEQRITRRPGLISHLMDVEVTGASQLGSGNRLSDREIFMLALQIIAGGVDTTTSLTSNTFVFLDRDRDARQKLIESPSLRPRACEEFVRLASPVQALCRTAARDIQIGDQTIRAGDRVMFSFASANRDDREFANPDTVDVTRFPNRHVGFGIGIHRCIGSTFARMMFGIMLDAVLERIPDYKVDHARAVHYPTMSSVNGWKSIPAHFTPGTKRGASSVLPKWKDAVDLKESLNASGVSMAEMVRS